MASRPEVSQALLAKSRCEFGIRIQFLTGFLRRHEWVVDSNCGKLPSNVDPKCRLCGQGDERPNHLWGCKGIYENLSKSRKTLGELKHLISS